MRDGLLWMRLTATAEPLLPTASQAIGRKPWGSDQHRQSLTMRTPIILILFNRPNTTERVMREIVKARPPKLFLIADGPRPDNPEDAAKCAAARSVAERVEWDCEVIKNYSDVNLGCGRRPATGISWVFEQVDEAIILEDDCVPHPSFFRFCEELLERYRDDERVMHIAGCTYRRDPLPIPYSYYFSCFNGAWGWATWRRAWRYFDLGLELWPSLKNSAWLKDLVGNEIAIRYWASQFERAYECAGNVSYWDHQWTFACWANSGLSIAPRNNLVSNVGYGPDATNTFSEDDPTLNLPLDNMEFPLAHPPMVLQSRELDRRKLQEWVLPRLPQPPSPVQRLRQLASRVAPEFVKQGYRRLAAATRLSEA
jgi:hypothetical protein